MTALILATMLVAQAQAKPAPSAPQRLDGEKGGLDRAMGYARLGRSGEAARLLAGLKSAQAKALRASLIGEDTVQARRRGITRFDPELAQRLAKEALPELKKQAPTDPTSARLLGALSFWGVGTNGDVSLGARWWKYAAEKGDPAAMASLALCYRDGLGVDQDKKAAFTLAKQAADAGHPRGMDLLGEFYSLGELAPKNPVMAASLWEKAAKLGYVDSMMRCADLAFDRAMKALNEGEPTAPTRYFKSYADWLAKAADAGDAQAMLLRADAFRVGLGSAVPLDRALSFRSYSQAAESGLTMPLASLACCLYTGFSVKSNVARADELLKEAVAAAARDGFKDRKALEAVAAAPDTESRKAALLTFLLWNDTDRNDTAEDGQDAALTASTEDAKSKATGTPRKRRYKSQAAQRQANLDMINGMLQGALVADEQAKTAQVQAMTPQPQAGRAHYCGASTLDGTPCTRLVFGPGYCDQHR
jgi:TPR repeat protein